MLLAGRTSAIFGSVTGLSVTGIEFTALLWFCNSSVLENYHVSTAFTHTLRDLEVNIFRNLDKYIFLNFNNVCEVKFCVKLLMLFAPLSVEHVSCRTFSNTFCARQNKAKRAYAITIPSVRLSVCPSVCPSVTRVDQSKAVEVRIMQFSPHSSPIPLVFVR